MALVTSDFLSGVLTSFKAIFLNAFTEADKVAAWRALCLLTDSFSDKESYNWLEAVPALSEWKDMRIVTGLSAKGYEITNKNYEGTIGVDRNTLEDDKYALIAPRVRQLAVRAANHPAKLIYQLLNAGASTVTYDGVNFFSASRTFGNSGNINNIAGGAYAADGDKIRAGIAAAVQAMRNFKDDRGEYLDLVPDTIVCSAVMELPIRNALLPAVAGTERAEAELIKNIVVSPYFTSGATAGHDYYLVATQNELKPMLFQMRKKPEFVALDKPDNHDVFMKRLVHYGIDGRYAAALLEPRAAVMVDCSD
ncbi:MAG: Mu-like prophage major head subunit gpT family protein [Dehalococcoidales bacterium]|jgi:phage major head subunit gpT-like protein